MFPDEIEANRIIMKLKKTVDTNKIMIFLKNFIK